MKTNTGFPQTGVSLAKRLERLKKSLPSDDQYGDYLARTLEQLLDTPLAELCGREGEEYADSLREDLIRLGAFKSWAYREKLFVDRERKLSYTYKETLLLITKIKRMSESPARPFSQQEALRKDYELLLYKLSRLLIRRPECPSLRDGEAVSLAERLSTAGASQLQDDEEVCLRLKRAPRSQWNDIMRTATRTGEYPILGVPLSHYFYAAARWRASEVPLQTGQRNFAAFLDPKNIMFNLAFMVKLGMDETPRANTNGLRDPDYSLLYDLLVEPIIPGVNSTGKGEEGK